MRNEVIISAHLNPFALKPHNGLDSSFLFGVHNTVLHFFIFTPSLKIKKKNALYGDDVIPSVSMSLNIRAEILHRILEKFGISLFTHAVGVTLLCENRSSDSRTLLTEVN